MEEELSEVSQVRIVTPIITNCSTMESGYCPASWGCVEPDLWLNTWRKKLKSMGHHWMNIYTSLILEGCWVYKHHLHVLLALLIMPTGREPTGCSHEKPLQLGTLRPQISAPSFCSDYFLTSLLCYHLLYRVLLFCLSIASLKLSSSHLDKRAQQTLNIPK